MKKEKIITALIGFLLGAAVLYGTNIYLQDSGNGFDSITTGSTDPGDAEITLYPERIEGGEVVFTLSIDTHSVSLVDHDLGEQTTLRAGGENFEPEEYPDLYGHHVNGEVVFSTDKDLGSEGFEVVITDIPEPEERVFSW